MVYWRVLALILLVLLAACSSRAPRRTAPPLSGAQAAAANDVLFRALGLVGTPYRWGGNTPEGGFDCSGLVGYVYREAAGLALPRTSSAMSELQAPRLGGDALVPGDLVFFGARGRISHVGIYVGERRFVHAPNAGGTVRLDSLDGAWWRENFAFGRRIL